MQQNSVILNKLCKQKRSKWDDLGVKWGETMRLSGEKLAFGVNSFEAIMQQMRSEHGTNTR